MNECYYLKIIYFTKDNQFLYLNNLTLSMGNTDQFILPHILSCVM